MNYESLLDKLEVDVLYLATCERVYFWGPPKTKIVIYRDTDNVIKMSTGEDLSDNWRVTHVKRLEILEAEV